jgi:hypothetical protein
MADFGIDSFIGSMTYGGARGNLYTVTLNAPYGSADDLTFRCKAASLPAATVGVIEVPYMGQISKWPGNTTYEEWNVTILMDEGLEARRAIEVWQDAINGRESNITQDTTTRNHFIDAVVTQYNKDGSVGAEYTIHGMWPTSLGAVEMSWEAASAVLEFQCSFAVQYWTRNV